MISLEGYHLSSAAARSYAPRVLAEVWQLLQTTEPTKSTIGTVRHRIAKTLDGFCFCCILVFLILCREQRWSGFRLQSFYCIIWRNEASGWFHQAGSIPRRKELAWISCLLATSCFAHYLRAHIASPLSQGGQQWRHTRNQGEPFEGHSQFTNIHW